MNYVLYCKISPTGEPILRESISFIVSDLYEPNSGGEKICFRGCTFIENKLFEFSRKIIKESGFSERCFRRKSDTKSGELCIQDNVITSKIEKDYYSSLNFYEKSYRINYKLLKNDYFVVSGKNKNRDIVYRYVWHKFGKEKVLHLNYKESNKVFWEDILSVLVKSS
jgi:hypothetical protein